MRAKEIYDGLWKRFDKICDDEPWIKELKKDYSLDYKQWTAECFFLITISWGPWVLGRQKQVWKNMKKLYPEVVEDIRNVGENFKGFPFEWQNERVKGLGVKLRKERKSLSEVACDLASLDGIKARNTLADMCQARNNKKTISCFVRDFLLKDTFPLDTRVVEMLSCLGLPNDEDQIIRLCVIDGVKSRILNRMLYSKWDICPDEYPGDKNQCTECPINNYCWQFILK